MSVLVDANCYPISAANARSGGVSARVPEAPSLSSLEREPGCSRDYYECAGWFYIEWDPRFGCWFACRSDGSTISTAWRKGDAQRLIVEHQAEQEREKEQASERAERRERIERRRVEPNGI